MPDSVVNVSAASSIIFPVRTVYFARAGALEVSGRMLPGESRNSTSPGRVGCGLPRAPPAGIVHEARPRAGNDRVFLRAARALAFGRKMEPVRAAFFQKRSIMGALRVSNPEKLTFILILVPTRFLFHARFRFERRNPRLERRCLDPFVTGVPPCLVLSCLLTLYTAVMSFEILFPFGLWVSEPGWLLNHSQLV